MISVFCLTLFACLHHLNAGKLIIWILKKSYTMASEICLNKLPFSRSPLWSEIGQKLLRTNKTVAPV